MKLAYYRSLLEENGVAELFRYFGTASFGGGFGALCIAHALAYVFPLPYAIGRLGGTLTHSRPGVRSGGWPAVMLWLPYRKAQPIVFFNADALTGNGLRLRRLNPQHFDPPVSWGLPVNRSTATFPRFAEAAVITSEKRHRVEAEWN